MCIGGAMGARKRDGQASMHWMALEHCGGFVGAVVRVCRFRVAWDMGEGRFREDLSFSKWRFGGIISESELRGLSRIRAIQERRQVVVPTIEQVLKHYRIISAAERMKTGRPGEETCANAIRGARCVCRAAGIPMDAPVSRLTRHAIDSALADFVERGLSRVSAHSYVMQLRSVFARWCLPYYKDAGWRIPSLELPVFRARAPHYVRPSEEMLERVKRWYRRQKGEMWFAATMMLEFAMRNGDVLRLRGENFVTRGEGDGVRHFLSYMPHKTALTSGRRVFWPIHKEIWGAIEESGGFDGFDVTDETFDAINRDMRSLGFTGGKGAYELRKICIDHVYQRYGAEAASSISGDDIKTITRYYADPAQPNIGAKRIIDLL